MAPEGDTVDNYTSKRNVNTSKLRLTVDKRDIVNDVNASIWSKLVTSVSTSLSLIRVTKLNLSTNYRRSDEICKPSCTLTFALQLVTSHS